MENKIITEESLISLREGIKPYLDEKRYHHTLAVEREAARLGEIYLPEKVTSLRAAALLHDITKKCDFEKQLQYCRRGSITLKNMSVLFPASTDRVKDVAKKLTAKLLEQKILAFKMSVKGCSANVSSLYYLGNGDLIEMLLGKKLSKRLKYRLSRLFLPSVHIFLRTVSRICSVLNDQNKVYVDFNLTFKYTYTAQFVR